MQPRAEMVHLVFASGVLVLGLMSFSTKSFERSSQRLDPRQSASNVLILLRHL